MKKYIEKLKSNKKALYISIAILILFVGTTFAYVAAQLSGGVFKLFNLNADTTDQLEFNVDKDISLSANQFNFAEGAGNLSDQAVATARLKANSTKNTATYTYNVYLLIDKNEFKYTTSDKKTEILLQVTDPNGNNLTELSDLKYDSTLQGFDITEANDELIKIAQDYEITSDSSANYTEQTWVIKVVFINLDTNQKANAGKSLESKVLIQQQKKYQNINIEVNGLRQTYGNLAELNCPNTISDYNARYNRIEITNMNYKNINCYLNYTNSELKEYLNNKIIELVGTTQGEGQVVNEKGYRYEGLNPNNYIWFNDEMWRIVGVFEDSSHGIKNQKLTKIVKNDHIGSLIWTTSDDSYTSKSNWNEASLNILLNNAYFYQKNANEDNYLDSLCYLYYYKSSSTDIQTKYIKGNCNYSTKGISIPYRNMVQKVKWFLGEMTTEDTTVENYYNYERQTNLFSENYIGLLYPSDYGYSVLESNCNRTTKLINYNNNNCSGKTWLYGKGDEWTMTKGTSNYIVHVMESGKVGSKVSVGSFSYDIGSTTSANGVRPSLYLNSNVFIISGTGTENDPYIIGM